jgi:hypothetical protein
VVNLLRKSSGQFKPLKGGQFVRFMHIPSWRNNN